ncbi:hypothetical protein QJS10_CPA09g00232 [Acorus calamus]|uniref:Red chlorophyll catabolite reductase n=1 Tax=Acorus calamus TaxID=4465 RepID=A0AAV9EC36_ACOCL|nr:hypothetical protein QJS10_CPA09g00232 [Acorus calamus]
MLLLPAFHLSRRLPSPPLPPLRRRSSSQRTFPPPMASSSSSSSERVIAAGGGSGGWLPEFPNLSPSHRDLMAGILSEIDSRAGPLLLPSSVPADVRSFENEQGTCRGALDIRPGVVDGSTINFILASWLHCELPFGALDITTMFGFLNATTDAPHLLMEFIQSSPKSLIIFMDLLPRKDLVLHPDHLTTFYEDTHIDKQRQELEKVTGALPYFSNSLYIRSVLSPTAIALNISLAEDGEVNMEEVLRDSVSPVSKEVARTWLDKCVCSERGVSEVERVDLVRRDSLIKTKTVEIDLAANLPRLFGPDVAERVVEAIQKAFKIK